MEYDQIIAIIGVAMAVLTLPAYLSLRQKIAELIDTCCDTLALGYAVVGDILDGGEVDKPRIIALKKKIEETWTQAEDLAPFIRDLMSSKRSAILSLGGAEKDPSFGKDTSEEAD
jgi:hypothetical protein